MSYIFNETLAISTGVGVGGTPISGGTSGRLLYDKSGVLGETAFVNYDGSTGGITFSGADANGLSAVVTQAFPRIGFNDTQASGNFWTIGPNVINGNSTFIFYDGTLGKGNLTINQDGAGAIAVRSGAVIGWSSDANLAQNAAIDTSLSRASAGVLNVTSTSSPVVLQLGSVSALFRVANGSGDNWYIGNAGNTNTANIGLTGMGGGALGVANGAVFDTAIGSGGTMASLVTGNQNVAIGSFALNVLNGSGDNTAIGFGAGSGVTSGSNNTLIGCKAGSHISNGTQNTIIGEFDGTGATVTTGSHNIIIGSECDVASVSANGQLSIGNFIYGTGLTATGSTISTGWIGIGGKAAFGAEALGVTGGITISGDPGGAASTNTVSGANSTTISTGTGTVKMSSANNANNTGWLKCYIGTQVAWIPCWTTNAP